MAIGIIKNNYSIPVVNESCNAGFIFMPPSIMINYFHTFIIFYSPTITVFPCLFIIQGSSFVSFVDGRSADELISVKSFIPFIEVVNSRETPLSPRISSSTLHQ